MSSNEERAAERAIAQERAAGRAAAQDARVRRSIEEATRGIADTWRRDDARRRSKAEDVFVGAAVSPPARTSIVFQPRRDPPPSLRDMTLDLLSAHASELGTDAINALDLETAGDLLRWILKKQKLTTPIAKRFISSRHDELAAALKQLDLVAGV
eukprot:CAMPEP_0119277626 /NCGR_PEP_ID=MMETSP1329-20130426/17562_1 /TAXON_ID=114041 /ORGANISM="Genus nov. species nov., Strain RCC1024" /LENGTH=154 /DNA_ID=CAMNT_0007278111 /DNA_START=62 /DNA_END=523 /DNA_ORIENTATION=-